MNELKSPLLLQLSEEPVDDLTPSLAHRFRASIIQISNIRRWDLQEEPIKMIVTEGGVSLLLR
jgi:hypothetical protein